MRIGRTSLILLALAAPTHAEYWLEPGDKLEGMVPMRIVNGSTPRLVQLLSADLKLEADPARRARLCADLAATERADAVPALVEALGDPSDRVRAAAARALGQLNARNAADQIRPLLRDAQASVRAAAVGSLGSMGDTAAVLAALDDADPVVVLEAIAFARSAELQRALLQRFDRFSIPLIVASLAQIDDASAAPLLASTLAGPSVPVRVAALQTAARIGDATLAGAVLPLLSDPHPSVRRSALQALPRVAADQAQPRAIAALDDGDATVREAACRLLVDAPAPAALPRLLAQLDDGYFPLNTAARDAIVAAAAGDREAVIRAGVVLLDHADAPRRADGSFILGQLRSDAAFERHVALLADPDWPTAAQAARSIGRIGKPDAGAALVALYQRAYAQVSSGARDADAGADAIEAATRIGHTGILSATARIVGNRNEYAPMRVKAVWAFGVLGSAADEQTCNRLIRILGDELEIGTVQFEAAKALGAVRFGPAVEALRAKAREGSDASLSWICHHAADRIAGTTTPYTAPRLIRRPDTHITDEQHDRTPPPDDAGVITPAAM